MKPAGETDLRPAQEVWADLQAHKMEQYAIFRFIEQEAGAPEAGARGIIDRVELAYYAEDTRSVQLNAVPQWWAGRSVMPLYRFTGQLADGRKFEIVAEAAQVAKLPEIPPTAAPIIMPTDQTGHPSMSLSPRACDSPVAVTPDPSDPAQPGRMIGGGTVPSGDFQIFLWLTCDSNFGPGSRYLSEIGSLGLHVGWSYTGKQIEGTTFDYYGIEPYIAERSSRGPSLPTAERAVADNGIQAEPDLFADFSGSEYPLRFVYKVRDPLGHFYGAALSFRLVRQVDGFVVRDILTGPLSEAELAARPAPLARYAAVFSHPVCRPTGVGPPAAARETA